MLSFPVMFFCYSDPCRVPGGPGGAVSDTAQMCGEVREANNTAYSPLLLKQSKRERPVPACAHTRVCVCAHACGACLLFYEKLQLARKL